LNSAFEELARQFEAKRQQLTLILSKKFEQERMLLEEKVVKPLIRTEKEMMQAETAIR
jgi:hypothetical protein